MKKDLQDKLYAKYPKIFRQKDLDKMQTLMCWGIETDDGWYDLIDEVCQHLQWNTDKNGHPQVEFVQVKEKYGDLRIYTSVCPVKKKPVKFMDKFVGIFIWITDKLWWKGLISSDYRLAYANDERCNGSIDGKIDFVESFSTRVCEVCGEKGNLQNRGSWLKTLCEKHRIELEYEPIVPEEEIKEDKDLNASIRGGDHGVE